MPVRSILRSASGRLFVDTFMRSINTPELSNIPIFPLYSLRIYTVVSESVLGDNDIVLIDLSMSLIIVFNSFIRIYNVTDTRIRIIDIVIVMNNSLTDTLSYLLCSILLHSFLLICLIILLSNREIYIQIKCFGVKMEFTDKKESGSRKLKIIASIISIIVLFVMLSILVVGTYLTVKISNNYKHGIDTSFFSVSASRGSSKVFYYDFTDRKNRIGEVVEIIDERLTGSENSIYVTYEAIPQNLIDAFVAIEDKRFWQHSGVDWKRTVAAVIDYFTDNGSFGGSTITQQLIKNVTGKKDYSKERKLQEIIWALDIETKLDKTEILEYYLNIINLSQGCSGVQAAANTYFSKDVSALSLVECAAIAAITNNPSYYDPIRYPENNLKRRNIIISEMYDQGYITEEEYQSSYNVEIKIDTSWKKNGNSINSWYIDMVIEDVINDLCEEYGYTRQASSMLVYSGGLRIYTAMDKDVQKVIEDYYAEESNFVNLKKDNKLQSSMIIIDPLTGDILGVAGAIGKKNANRLQNYATMTVRPSGSTIKPLSVYAPALEAGIITSATVYDDVPILFKGKTSISAWPKNSPSVYNGLTNVTDAIRTSVNTVAVKILDNVGEQKSFDFLRNDLGMKSLIDKKILDDGSIVSDIGLASLALGQQNYGVTVRELTGAYSIFANGGIFNETRSYFKVTDSRGNVLLSDKAVNRRVIGEDTASIMTLMLKEVIKNGTAKDITIDKYVDVAGKTGTTQDNCDKWFVGYTPSYIGGVWTGCEYPVPLDDIDGNPCIEVWDDIMKKLYINNSYSYDSSKKFKISNNIVKVRVCSDSGLIPTEACRCDARGDRGVWRFFTNGSEPKKYCDCHILVDYDVVNGGVACDKCPKENIVKVGMIQVNRNFPIQIYISDAQYVWCDLPNTVEPGLLSNAPFFINKMKRGHYFGISRGDTQYNRYCIFDYISDGTETKDDIVFDNNINID